ncbi:hydroxyacylglutathione hydrolase [Niveibacterium sp. 24ML]|uniref:hydroxyacylglutathione hydrolase n=1 Tax=Niveibacterium sp. 24ML TaxID=2985512 RepID=UPI0022713148|nr:hydroxyacylglutathione hydrolase [Niveibacterium sp. 24ML]MCX9157084.1 hydroxyacylglutathione hydrolase [Niveibacterium sp. 24ML]
MQIVPLSAFSDNYIWAIVAQGRCVVVDPGDARPVEGFLKTQGLVLDAILITHHHGDHAGGIGALCSTSAVPVYGPAHEAIAGISHPVQGGDSLTLLDGALPLSVLDVPGHTAGHIAYVTPGAVFCGDTLFSAGCGRLFEGSPAQMHQSLATLAALPDDTALYCAHEYTLANLRFATAVEPGNPDIAAYTVQCQAQRAADTSTLPSSIGLEKRVNPFLRCSTPAVRHAAEGFAEAPLPDTTAVFAALRRWKNEFR